jgi:glycosyltransferase involved in cell wall biosynthesis
VNNSISVIIPTFNRADMLRRAIDSVLQQSLPPRELMIVDDGSSDATRELVTAIQQRTTDSGGVARAAPQVRYLYQSNSGVSAARNRGIRHASGEWLAFLDSDDAWLPRKLETQAKMLARFPGHRLCHTQEQWIRHGRRINQMKKHRKSGGAIFPSCLPLCVISPSSAIIHRTLFDDVGLFDETLPACEDYDLWLRICAHEEVLYVDTPLLLKYGGHGDQLSRRYWGMDRFRLQALQKILRDPGLRGDYRRLVQATLVRKARILREGAEKRGNHSRAAYFMAIEEHYGTTGEGLATFHAEGK